MARRLATYAAVIGVVWACLALCGPTSAAGASGAHAALYSDDAGVVQLRSADYLPATFTIQVRAAPCIYIPVQSGVLAPQSMTAVPVPCAAPGMGAMYVVSFMGAGSVAYIFHPDDWNWDL